MTEVKLNPGNFSVSLNSNISNPLSENILFDKSGSDSVEAVRAQLLREQNKSLFEYSAPEPEASTQSFDLLGHAPLTLSTSLSTPVSENIRMLAESDGIVSVNASFAVRSAREFLVENISDNLTARFLDNTSVRNMLFGADDADPLSNDLEGSLKYQLTGCAVSAAASYAVDSIIGKAFGSISLGSGGKPGYELETKDVHWLVHGKGTFDSLGDLFTGKVEWQETGGLIPAAKSIITGIKDKDGYAVMDGIHGLLTSNSNSSEEMFGITANGIRDSYEKSIRR